MKIDTALILCAGFGKRLNPLTLKTPKPLLKINNKTLLEGCISMLIKLEIKKILLNTFHLKQQIFDFIKNTKFPIEIEIIDEGNDILNTGGGIVNMSHYSKSDDFLILNPDTLWGDGYVDEIKKMQNLYFLNKLTNILLVTKKDLSFDKNLSGDFDLAKNLLKKNNNKKFIYIGCQILNKNLLKNRQKINFPINEIWNELLKKKELNGFESLIKFRHLTNSEVFKKLSDL
jgi:MurNAc alpha-1-phosphate uridylyltransferase